MNIIFVNCWYVYGHHTGNPDFYTNLFADCRESWDVLYPVRRNVDIQHVYGKYDTAGRFGIVRILWY